MSLYRIFFISLIMLGLSHGLVAQKYLNKQSRGFYRRAAQRNLILTFGSGTTHYYGDLAKPGDHTNIKPTVTAGARLRFQDRLLLGTDLTWFMLTGTDDKDPVKAPRNLSFQSHNFEWNLTFQIQLFEETPFYLRKAVNPYAYAGVGILSFNPTAEIDNERHALRPLKTEGVDYGSVTMSFPVGAGIRIKINPYFNIAIDGGYRFLTTDYLDDVSSGIYPEPASFNSDLARRLSDRTGEYGIDPTYAEQGVMVRGDPNNKDGYFITNIKLEYYFRQIKIKSAYRKKIRPYEPPNKPKYGRWGGRRRRL